MKLDYILVDARIVVFMQNSFVLLNCLDRALGYGWSVGRLLQDGLSLPHVWQRVKFICYNASETWSFLSLRKTAWPLNMWSTASKHSSRVPTKRHRKRCTMPMRAQSRESDKASFEDLVVRRMLPIVIRSPPDLSNPYLATKRKNPHLQCEYL